MKMDPKYILKLAGTLFLITALVAAALAGVNSITAPRIEAINIQKHQVSTSVGKSSLQILTKLVFIPKSSQRIIKMAQILFRNSTYHEIRFVFIISNNCTMTINPDLIAIPLNPSVIHVVNILFSL